MAFVIGVVVLTVLPFMQQRFLKAPPPMRALPAWELVGLADAGPVSSQTLSGHVVLMELAAAPCDEACVARQERFGNGLSHTDDLRDAIALVTVVMPAAEDALRKLASPGSRWHLATGSPAQLAVLLGALDQGWSEWAHTDAGSTPEEFSRLPAVLVLDQRGALRGFWHDDEPGRGNAINAARLLASHPEVDSNRAP
jgi:cytochrome oxidase Cu insertion factor (SCO1/SenC/PrrC family)